jgi:UDP-N-acetyl-D-mannosaminuronic acid dehydrogenase
MPPPPSTSIATPTPPPKSPFTKDVCVIGGAGHVGLPLALTFADCGLDTVIYDIDRPKLSRIAAGQMPFREHGGPEMLARALASGKLTVTDSPAPLADCRFLVLIIGTPVDEHLNPGFHSIHKAIDACDPYLRDGQTLILRSTVFPGITQHIQRYVRDKGKNISVSFCPERVAEGYSIKEFKELPQIISAFDDTTLSAVKQLFGLFCPEFVEMTPMEAELCKLMTNSWRYIQFATVNQFYMIATDNGLDFNRILHGCRHNYPRMAGMPGPGFAAGPCLLKDTMQLSAFSHNQFVLGHAAMLINEGLPQHVVDLASTAATAASRPGLADKTAAILGMAFKAECDDPRDSLSYKLRKLLLLECKSVVCTDPFVSDPTFVPLETALQADLIFVGAPHKAYRGLKLPPGKIEVDVWNCLG